MTQTEKLKLIAEFDGLHCTENSNGTFSAKRKYISVNSTELDYLTNLTTLHTVAMNVICALVDLSKLQGGEHYMTRTKATRLRRMIEAGCSFPRKAGGYIDLFEAVAAGVEFLNKHKTK